MAGSNREAWGTMERTRAIGSGRSNFVGGLLALSTALGLWAFVVAGIAAPLGDAVALLDRAESAQPEGPAQPETTAQPEDQALAACTIPPESISQGPDVLASASPGVMAPHGAGVMASGGSDVAASAASAVHDIVTSAPGEAVAPAPSGAIAMAPRDSLGNDGGCR